jgi:Trk K+ transport system NAD-binding subunit
VLGLTRHGVYQGTPNGQTRVEPGDSLVLYGRGADLADLDRRPAGPAGERAHLESVELQRLR